MDALVKAAQAEGNLTVITLPRDWCDYGDMMDNFTAKYGIKIQDVNPEGGSADEVQAIKDNEQNVGPQAPDVLDIGPAYGPLAAGQNPTGPNLLAPYKVAPGIPSRAARILLASTTSIIMVCCPSK